MLFCPRPLEALVFLRDSWLRLWCRLLPHTCMLPNGLSGWFWGGRGGQHLKELAVKLSKLGFKFQLYSLTWTSNSTSLHIFISKLGKKVHPHFDLCFCCGQKLRWVNGSSSFGGSSWLKEKAPFLGNLLGVAEENLGTDVGDKWKQERRLLWEEVGGTSKEEGIGDVRF